MRGPWARLPRPRPRPHRSPLRHCRLKLRRLSARWAMLPSVLALRRVPAARAPVLRERARRPEAASLSLPPRSPLALPASHRPRETAQLRQTINFPSCLLPRRARGAAPVLAALSRWNDQGIPSQQGAMRRFLACWMGLIACGVSSVTRADPTGLIRMPDAQFDPDGTLRFGMASALPYFSLTANATLLPWLETNLGVTRISGVPGFSTSRGGFGAGYGAYKDKTSGLKVRLIAEGGGGPSVAVGAQGPIGTRLFERQYAAATKTFGDAQFTLGYGHKQIKGAYWGARYSPSWLRNWSLVTEYDASDYENFPFAEGTRVSGRTRGISNAIEYHLGWMSAAVSNERGVTGLNAYVSIPLERAEWIPKTAEPEPYAKVIPRPTLAQWEQDASYRKRMYEALHRQDFKD